MIDLLLLLLLGRLLGLFLFLCVCARVFWDEALKAADCSQLSQSMLGWWASADWLRPTAVPMCVWVCCLWLVAGWWIFVHCYLFLIVSCPLKIKNNASRQVIAHSRGRGNNIEGKQKSIKINYSWCFFELSTAADNQMIRWYRIQTKKSTVSISRTKNEQANNQANNKFKINRCH